MKSFDYSEQNIINTVFISSEQYSGAIRPYIQEVQRSNIEAIQNLVQASKKVLVYQEFTPINKLQAVRLVKDMMNQNNFYVVKEIKINLLSYFVEVCKYQKGNPKENRGAAYFSRYGNDKKLMTIANSFFRLHLECIQAWAIYYPKDNEFTQAYALLIQESVSFPNKFTYFKQAELQERKLIVPAGEQLEIKKEPQMIKKLKEQLATLQNQKDFVVTLVNLEKQNEIQWDMVQEVANFFKIFINELQKYCDQLFNLDETYQSQYFNILLEEQELLTQFLEDTSQLQKNKFQFSEFKRKYVFSGKLSAQQLQQTTPGEGQPEQTDEQRVQELQKNQLEELKEVAHEEKKANENQQQQEDQQKQEEEKKEEQKKIEQIEQMKEELKSMGKFYQSNYIEKPQNLQQIDKDSQSQHSQQYSELEMRTIECLQSMDKYKTFLSEISSIIMQQNFDSCNELLQILDRNFLDIEKLPDKKNEEFYLLTIRLIKDIISTENSNMQTLGIFTNIFLSSNLLQKFTIYARYNKSSPNMNRGANILGNNNPKIQNSFFVCLLECLMGWAIIYPLTQFWNIFESLLWEGVTFPDKFIYFSKSKIKFSSYHDQLNKKIENSVEQFSLQIERNPEWNDNLARQLKECIDSFLKQIIQIKKLTAWYENSELPHNSDIQLLKKLEDQITGYCNEYEQLSDQQFTDYPSYHKKFAIQSIKEKFEQHKDDMSAEIIIGKAAFIDQQQEGWQLQSLPDPQKELTSRLLFEAINQQQVVNPSADFINQHFLTNELYQKSCQGLIDQVKNNQQNASELIIQSSLLLIKNQEYDIAQFLVAKYNSIQLIISLSQIQLQVIEFIKEIANTFILELSNYLVNLLMQKKEKIDLNYWLFKLDEQQEHFLAQYLNSCLNLFQLLEQNFPQYEVFVLESIKIFKLKPEFDKYFQCNPIVESTTLNLALWSQIKQIQESNKKLLYQLNEIIGKVQLHEREQTFDNDQILKQQFIDLFQFSSQIESDQINEDQITREKLKSSQEDQELQASQNSIKKIKNLYENYEKKVIKFKQFKQFVLKYGNLQQSKLHSAVKDSNIEIRQPIIYENYQQESQNNSQIIINQDQLQQIQPKTIQQNLSNYELNQASHSNIQEEFQNNQIQIIIPQKMDKPLQNKNLRQNNNQSYQSYLKQSASEEQKIQVPQQIEKQKQQPTFQDLFKDNSQNNIINYHLNVTSKGSTSFNYQTNMSPSSNRSFASNDLERQAQDNQKQALIIKENFALKQQLHQAEQQILELKTKNALLENSQKLAQQRYNQLINEFEIFKQGQNMLDYQPNLINQQIEEVKNNYALDSMKYDKLTKNQ